MKKRVLVVFADALGPRQVEELRVDVPGLATKVALRGILGFSSGALATVLTGVSPVVHRRMCLFAGRRDGVGPLEPLRWLGLLPRIVEERAVFRRLVGRAFARLKGYEGYFALHRVPAAAFRWLGVEEQDDLFTAPDIGGAQTFLARAREASLSVYSTPWQRPERERLEDALAVASCAPADLTFLYTAELDAALHRDGNDSRAARVAASRLSANVSRMRERLSRGADLTTLIVGDHGMADVRRVVDPGPLVRELGGARHFIDSTMLRIWGDAAVIERARRAADRLGRGFTFLDSRALVQAGVPAALYGDAMVLLEEGALFAPSFLGGAVRGMHGYAVDSGSASAALLSDAVLPASLRSLADVSSVVSSCLGLAS